MARSKGIRTPAPVARTLYAELSETDKARLSVYVGYAELAHRELVAFVGSLAPKYRLEKEDAVLPDGTIIRKAAP